MLLSKSSLSWIKPDYRLLKKAGWQAVDLDELDDVKNMTYEEGLEYMTKVVREVTDAGLIVGQCHAPMPFWYFDLDGEGIEERENGIIRAVKIAGKLNIPYTIVHPWIYSPYEPDPDPEKTFNMNVDYLKRCVEAAVNTVVCVENLPGCRASIMNGEDMKKILDAVGDKLCACLDTGHAISNGVKTSDFFEKAGDRIKTLHIHDNFNTGNHDMHLLPYQGEVDWEDFISTLKKYNYQGNLNDESMLSVRVPQEARLESEIVEVKVMQSLLNAIK